MRYVFYDTETTGLNFKKDKVIEIAGYEAVSKETFLSFVNPHLPIPKEVSYVHKITDDMVKDAPSFEKVGKEFIDFCTKDCILIAHNNDAFDFHFLKEEFFNANLEMPSWRFIDTLKWAKKYRPDLPKHHLQYLREYHEIEKKQAHRALDDVQVLYQVFQKMIDDLSYEKVYELLHQKKKIRMPFGKHRGKVLKDVPKGYVNWLLENKVFDKIENQELKKEFEKLGLL